ncbi:MAG: uroporphyrinogen decarboxylase, partial [Myxococcales bacterium]|nr:uroporphyrinogen decarboxylase [Myxococcales bacterium]
YRAVREGVSFLEMCADVDRAVTVSLQPLELVGSEAVILFSDIFVPVLSMNVELDFAPGPVIAEPIRARRQVEALSTADPRKGVPYVFEILRRLRRELAPREIPLLGFAGAPFTLACYLIRGSGDPDRRFAEVTTLMAREPELMHALLDKLGVVMADYLVAQVEAGAHAVQLFDTWAGILDDATYRRFALPVVRKIAGALRGKAPFILFGGEAPHLVDAMLDSGCDVLSVGSCVDLAAVARRAGGNTSVQGNLPPEDLKRSREDIFDAVRRLADAARPARGHILNLGHGCTPETPVAGVRAFTDAARALATDAAFALR